jgi:hypothetical protein
LISFNLLYLESNNSSHQLNNCSNTTSEISVSSTEPYTFQNYIQIYYPNLSVLVLNSLTSVIEDDTVQVQRLALDFIISRLPIQNKILSEEEKIALIISALNLLIKNDYSTTRRLFAWLLGGMEEETEMGDPTIQYMIELVIRSIRKIFNSKNYTKDKLNNGLKIVDQLFKQQVKLVDYVLERVSIDMISCVEHYWTNFLGNREGNLERNSTNQDEVLLKLKKFFDYDSTYLDCLWGSLNKMLINAVKENSVNDINTAVRLLNFCSNYIKLQFLEKINKFYIPVVSSLLKAMLSFKIESIEHLDNIKPLLVLSLKFVQEMKEKATQAQLARESIKNTSTQSKQDFGTSKIFIKPSLNNSSLEYFMENILLFQTYYIDICKLLLESVESTSKKMIKIFKKATELVLVTQEYSNSLELPEWVVFLVKIVFCQDVEFSLEGINYLLDLLIIDSGNEVFTNIKYYLRSEAIDEEILSTKGKTNTLNQNISIPLNKSGSTISHFGSLSKNPCELSMAKLWLLLESQNFQKPVIDLLIKFYKAEPHVFSNTISNTFAMSDLEQNVNAIRKFSQFWKLTSEYYPEYIFFENGECIFKMLDFLDHDHPLLRHLSKSWLSQSVSHFSKILDPLLKVLLDKETTWYISPRKGLYFAKEYDNRRIIEAFRKLKNIIINMTDLAIGYFVNTPISQFLIEMDDTGRELSSVTRSIPLEHYLEMMVSISLRFIQGKFIESVSQSFYRENFSVNAAACEFLEFLLSFIEPKSKVMAIAEMIAEPVLMILHESIMGNDEVMQVQLLNLLKVLLFNTGMVHKDFLTQAVNIFNSQLLHDCITLGIGMDYIFVRSHFISFVEYCLPIFRDILDADSNLRIAHRLIITTSDFLFRRVKYGDSFSLRLSQNEPMKFFIVKNYLEEYRDLKSFDENDVHVIIKGLKQILFHFFSIEHPVLSAEKINWMDIKKLLHNKNVNSNSFKDYLSSLFSRGNFDSPDLNKGKRDNEMSNAIFAIFEDVLASLLNSWINESDQYMTKDLCLNENGVLPYNPDEIKFQNYVNDEQANKASKN